MTTTMMTLTAAIRTVTSLSLAVTFAASCTVAAVHERMIPDEYAYVPTRVADVVEGVVTRTSPPGVDGHYAPVDGDVAAAVAIVTTTEHNGVRATPIRNVMPIRFAVVGQTSGYERARVDALLGQIADTIGQPLEETTRDQAWLLIDTTREGRPTWQAYAPPGRSDWDWCEARTGAVRAGIHEEILQCFGLIGDWGPLGGRSLLNTGESDPSPVMTDFDWWVLRRYYAADRADIDAGRWDAVFFAD